MTFKMNNNELYFFFKPATGCLQVCRPGFKCRTELDFGHMLAWADLLWGRVSLQGSSSSSKLKLKVKIETKVVFDNYQNQIQYVSPPACD